MNKWVKKSLAFLITLVTLGAFTPTTLLEVDAKAEKTDVIFSETNEKELKQQVTNHDIEDKLDFIFKESSFTFDELDIDDYFVHLLTEQAKEEIKNKLGTKIYEKVEDDVEAIIFPVMEEIISSMVTENGKEEAQYYWIKTNANYGEKIFEVYDERTNEEIARFDVSRVKRPKDGYWFCFHYHLSEDNFEEHHHLGEIYWDKNMPPKWKL